MDIDDNLPLICFKFKIVGEWLEGQWTLMEFNGTNLYLKRKIFHLFSLAEILKNARCFFSKGINFSRFYNKKLFEKIAFNFDKIEVIF